MKKFHLSLLTKTLLAVIVVFLPLIIAFVYNFNINKKILMGHALEDLSSQAFVYEEVVSQFLGKSMNRVQDFSSDGVIRNGTQNILDGNQSAIKILSDYIFKNKLIIDKSIHTISIISSDGKVLTSTDLSAVGSDFSGEKFFKEGKERVSVAEKRTVAPELPEIVASAPLSNISTGKPIGVIVNFIHISELNSILERIETEEYELEKRITEAELKRHRIKIYLVNKEKRLISKPSSVKDIELNHIMDTLPVRKALESNEEFSGFYDNYKKIRVAGASEYLSEMNWVLIMEEDIDDILAHTRIIGRNMLFTASIVIGIIILLFIVFFKNVVMRIQKVSAAVDDIAKGNYNITIPMRDEDEIGVLSRSFNRMASEINRRTIEIKESENKLKEAQRIAKIGNWDWDIVKNELHWSDEIYNIFGLNKEEISLTYETFINLIYPADREFVKNSVYDALYNKKPYSIDYRIVLTDGKEKIVHGEGMVILNGNDEPVRMLGTIQDVTEKKKLEDQLKHSQKMEAVGILAGGIAHDFNNILSAIMNYSNLLIMKRKEDEMTKKFAEQILEASRRGAGLTRGILAFSRKQPMNMQVVDLNEIIRMVEKMLKRMIGEDIELTIRLKDKPLIVNVDEVQIDQVMMNLSTNARDAMPKGGSIIVSTDIFELDEGYIRSHGYGAAGDFAMISFRDTGIGMDEETRMRIFEPFFTTKEFGRGTGLGLSISFGIIKQHNGFINVYSEPNKGTEFKIYLPITSEKPRVIESVEVTLSLNGTETVLLAEDEREVRETTKAILEEHGYKVIEAVDGEDAVQKFIENKDGIKLIISDMIMPKKSGKEAYDEIRKISPDIKVVFMSGYTADLLTEKDIHKGLDLILKPVASKELLKKVRGVIDRKN